MRIYKYTLDGDRDAADTARSVMLPEGAIVLRADVQNDQFCLWALVNETVPADRKHNFIIPAYPVDSVDTRGSIPAKGAGHGDQRGANGESHPQRGRPLSCLGEEGRGHV